MRGILVYMVVVGLAAGCTHSMRYEAIVQTEIRPDKPCDLATQERQLFLHTEQTETKLLAVACGITAIFYGGAC